MVAPRLLVILVDDALTTRTYNEDASKITSFAFRVALKVLSFRTAEIFKESEAEQTTRPRIKISNCLETSAITININLTTRPVLCTKELRTIVFVTNRYETRNMCPLLLQTGN